LHKNLSFFDAASVHSLRNLRAAGDMQWLKYKFGGPGTL